MIISRIVLCRKKSTAAGIFVYLSSTTPWYAANGWIYVRCDNVDEGTSSLSPAVHHRAEVPEWVLLTAFLVVTGTRNGSQMGTGSPTSMPRSRGEAVVERGKQLGQITEEC